MNLVSSVALALTLALTAPALAAQIDAGSKAKSGLQMAGTTDTSFLAMLRGPETMPPLLRPSMPLLENWLRASSPLRGRTLAVASAADIVLAPHEVVLTFDDGPTTGRTEGVLKILDDFGVKAVFMMVGKMAELHPQSAQAVALDGETIGTHTYDHPNLAKLTPEAAFEEIHHGQQAVAAVLAPVKAAPSPFFRFPYLASSWLLQAGLYAENTIVLSVQIDSDDYMRDDTATMLKQLLARLDQEGKGIVLFHDIHPKTLVVLPQFLEALRKRGYSVVQLVAKTPGPLETPLITASR